MWRALRDTFPRNVHPDNILIESLGQDENQRAYVSRVHQVLVVSGGVKTNNIFLQRKTTIQESLPKVEISNTDYSAADGEELKRFLSQQSISSSPIILPLNVIK
ncbi:hypothetical protein F2P81_001342 [Scophthalmus maximus]|uniref:Uncharacterized protein n=1 Tax=Scophthalmus maximus TaxID=52904 RepID=A0A6A4TS69_SCOMX|nr:hypothetical protein F2P81_001342 [Scophthalmus maximus]